MPKSTNKRKITAAIFLLIMIVNLLTPTVTYALTGGPTAPEASSFEPVDTTDMVNLQTGNLTYNIPLIEVPGPEGGYPLSLSYHAGIQTNEDASWVGLGWTLNPGAINRSVNGYPDDWISPTNTSRVYWKGGQTTTYRPGISIGLANTPFRVSAGLSFSNDTYQGFGTGFDIGIGMAIANSPFSAGVSIGVSPYGGGSSISGGIGVSYATPSGLSGSLGVNASTNFNSLQAGFAGGVGLGRMSLVGASIGTGSDKPSLEIGGLSSTVQSSTSAQVQTKTTGWGIDIPTLVPGLSISLGYSKERYWTDETTNVITRGSMYSVSGTSPVADNVAFDSYALLVDPTEKNFMDNPDPTILQGGAYPAFDSYEVNAQGLGGSMRPYQFQGQVFGQNHNYTGGLGCAGSINCTDYLVQFFAPRATDPTPQFRFSGDFSNSYRQNYPTYSPSQMTNASLLIGQPLPFDASPVHGDGIINGFQNNQLAGSKHVEVGITVHPAQLLGYNASERLQTGMIEGFSITNANGVMYTFGLPAYSYGEESYQEKVDQSGALNRQTKPTPYAYTWYLTSITGPDFVDRNNNGMADDNDWGYWINFNYGKFNSSYIWRNPSEGYNQDEDNEWQNCSMGRKEIYYLNSIRTRSHIALFEKDVRADAKGASPAIFDKNSPDPTYVYPGKFSNVSVSSMQLSRIYLMNAADENYVPANAGPFHSNVLDGSDVSAIGRSNVEAKAIRVIDFNYDYSLCQKTSNSFTTEGQLMGKLTLTSVKTRGKGGASNFPPVKFQYDLGSNAITQSGVTLTGANGSTPASFTSSNNNFNVGDLIYSSSLAKYCGVITAKSGSGTYTHTLANCEYTGTTTSADINTTKNPVYNKDAFDAWGMYKSDINIPLLSVDLNQARATTLLSSSSADAWSLRSVTTELGSRIDINYESDSYFTSTAEPNKQSLMITQIVVNQTNNTMTLTVDKGGNTAIHVADSYNNGDNLSAVLLQEFSPPVFPQSQDGSNSFGSMVSDTRTNSITFSDVVNNNPAGENRNFFITEALAGTLVVQSINDANNTVTVLCTDQLLLGKVSRQIHAYRGSNNFWTPETIYMRNSYGGNIFIKDKVAINGGGLRVKSLSVTEQLSGVRRITNYGYNDALGNTSGVSTYTPSMAEPCFSFPGQYSYTFYINAASKPLYHKWYRRTLYNNNSILYTLARDIPAPGVMYGYVSVSKQIKNPDELAIRNVDGVSKTQYQFEVFKGNMVGRMQVTTQQSGVVTYPNWNQYARNYTIGKFTSSIGNTKRIIQYDDNGNKLTETINHYLHDRYTDVDLSPNDFLPHYKALLQQYAYQGYIQERFSEVKIVGRQKDAADDGVKATLSAREEYPCIAVGQTVINYVNGTQTGSQNLAYDFYSGAVTKTVETDAYGNNFLTEVIPAYRVYTPMSLKINNANNKNMLTQTAATNVWKVDGSNVNVGLVSAKATTWANAISAIDADGNPHVQNGQTETINGTQYPNGDVWRQKSSYEWMPVNKTANGLTSTASFTGFNFTTPPVTGAWQKTSEVTLYDVNSKGLEGKDINNVSSATRLGYKNSKVVLTGDPANFYEIAYSGAEDDGLLKTNNLFVQDGAGMLVPAGVYHTGKQALMLAPHGSTGFIYTVNTSNLTPGRSYIANVWVRGGSTGAASDVHIYYNVKNGGTVVATSNSPHSNVSTKKNGDWALVTLNIPAAAVALGATLEVGCMNNDLNSVAFVDDFRFQPANAKTTAYVYDPFTGELTHILDNANLYTRFEYDAAGRLTATYKEKLNVGEIKATGMQYNMGACQYQNFMIYQIFTKNNCGSGYVGSMVTYTVPAGAYCSSESPTDASNQAYNDMTANGQQNANARGVCLIGGIMKVTATIPVQNPAMVVFFDAATNVFRGNFACYNGITYINQPPGNYTVQVFSTDNISRTISLTGFNSQTGSNVTFNNVTIGINQLNITVQ